MPLTVSAVIIGSGAPRGSPSSIGRTPPDPGSGYPHSAESQPVHPKVAAHIDLARGCRRRHCVHGRSFLCCPVFRAVGPGTSVILVVLRSCHMEAELTTPGQAPVASVAEAAERSHFALRRAVVDVAIGLLHTGCCLTPGTLTSRPGPGPILCLNANAELDTRFRARPRRRPPRGECGRMAYETSPAGTSTATAWSATGANAAPEPTDGKRPSTPLRDRQAARPAQAVQDGTRRAGRALGEEWTGGTGAGRCRQPASHPLKCLPLSDRGAP